MNIKESVGKILTRKNLIFTGIIVGLLILLWQVDSCRNSQFDAQKAAYDSVVLANQKLAQTINEKDQTISKQDLIIIQSDEDKERLKQTTLELFDLKKKEEKLVKQVNLLLQIKGNVQIKDRDVPYLDTTKMKKFSDSVERACATVIAYYRDNAVELTDTTDDGRKAKIVQIDSVASPYFQMKGYVLKNKFQIANLNMPDSQRIAVVVNKGGLFKKDTYGKLKVFKRKSLTILVMHTNPNIKITGMSSVEYIPKKKSRWLERGLIFGAGVAATLILTN